MKPSLELVTWTDAFIHMEATPGKADLATVETVGWVVYADEIKVEIAAERYTMEGETTWRAVTVIPAGWVTKRRRLK